MPSSKTHGGDSYLVSSTIAPLTTSYQQPTWTKFGGGAIDQPTGGVSTTGFVIPVANFNQATFSGTIDLTGATTGSAAWKVEFNNDPLASASKWTPIPIDNMGSPTGTAPEIIVPNGQLIRSDSFVGVARVAALIPCNYRWLRVSILGNAGAGSLAATSALFECYLGCV